MDIFKYSTTNTSFVFYQFQLRSVYRYCVKNKKKNCTLSKMEMDDRKFYRLIVGMQKSYLSGLKHIVKSY